VLGGLLSPPRLAQLPVFVGKTDEDVVDVGVLVVKLAAVTLEEEEELVVPERLGELEEVEDVNVDVSDGDDDDDDDVEDIEDFRELWELEELKEVDVDV
jgi:hypothetical protein